MKQWDLFRGTSQPAKTGSEYAWFHRHLTHSPIPKLLHILHTSPAIPRYYWNIGTVLWWPSFPGLPASTSNTWDILVTSYPSGWLRWPWILQCLQSCTVGFLVSTDGVSNLLHQLLPTQLSAALYCDRDLALSTWKDALPVDTPLPMTTNL